MLLDRLRDLVDRGRRMLEEVRDKSIVRGIGYGLVILLGFGAVLNLVVGIIAGLQGEWIAALGLVALGTALVIACELIVDYLVNGEGSGSVSSH